MKLQKVSYSQAADKQGAIRLSLPPKAVFAAKVTAPRETQAVERERLYLQLDQSGKRILTWIDGPGGAGKTALVANYLRNRKALAIWYSCDEGDADASNYFCYMRQASLRVLGDRAEALPLYVPDSVADLEQFTRRYFEQLSGMLLEAAADGQPTALVWDNFEQVPLSKTVEAILRSGPEAVHPDVNSIVISRNAPPAPLVRLLASEQIARLRYHDLRFTGQETKELVQMHQPASSSEVLAQIHRLTQGWAAGIILILAGHSDSKRGERVPAHADFESLTYYFVEEIFNHLEEPSQRFLLESSIFSTVKLGVACELSQTPQAQQILDFLNQSQLFTSRLNEDGSEYQYYPLLREFLQKKLHALYGAQQLRALQARAAELLEGVGAVDEAAQLYLEMEDPFRLARLVRQHAESWFAQGRTQTLQLWLEKVRGTAAEDPWILYWRGSCCALHDMKLAAVTLQQALDGFLEIDDRAGAYQAWASWVDALIFGFDDWQSLEKCLVQFEQMQAEDGTFPNRTLEVVVTTRVVSAMVLVRLLRPEDIAPWIERLVKLLEEPVAPQHRIAALYPVALYYLWRGAYGKNEMLLQKARAELKRYPLPPLVAIRMQTLVACHAWMTADHTTAQEAVDAALVLAVESGAHSFDPLLWGLKAASYLAQGKVAEGAGAIGRQLDSLVGHECALDLFSYHMNSAWHALSVGQPQLTQEHLQSVELAVERLGNPYFRCLWYLGMAKSQALLARFDEAMQHAEAALKLGHRMASDVIEWHARGVLTWIYFRNEQPTEAIACLRPALVLGKKHGFVHLQRYTQETASYLLARALEARIETEYLRDLIWRNQLHPPLQSADRRLVIAALFYWPFRIRIRTLGRFEVKLDDQPLASAGKTKKKPLEILKILIALGGVDVSEAELADRLWPNVDGDLAHKSLEMTVSRLRKLLGSDSAVMYQNHHVSLNLEECWIDCLVLDQVLSALDKLPMERVRECVDETLSLVRGRFLADDVGQDCFAECRERIAERTLSLLLRLARQAKEQEDLRLAADYYQRAMRLVPQAEVAYRQLMECQIQLGQRDEALRTYTHCERALRRHLQVAPSVETRALYRQLRAEAAACGSVCGAELSV